MAFVYSKLDHTHLIRLLHLLPGKKNDELSGTLFHCSLEEAPTYEALSYVWGSEQKPFKIQIQAEGDLAITESLHTALIRLRYQDLPRTLWIDAICINQGDNVERSEQVLLMPRIYSQAQHVRAWLGPDDDGSAAKVLELLEKLGQTDFASLPNMEVSQEWMQEHALPLMDDPIWDACVRFRQRQWFRRVWVVQEFVKARDLWMLCGPTEKHWKQLVVGVEMMKEYSLVSMGMIGHTDLGEEQDELRYGIEGFYMMAELKSASRLSSALVTGIRSFSTRDTSALPELMRGGYSQLSAFSTVMQNMVTILRANPETRPVMLDVLEPMLETLFEEKFNKTPPPSLIALTSIMQHQQATDPRDKLFALLGLSEEADDPRFRPDYNESLRSVTVRYAKALVDKEATFNILTFAGCAGRTSDLPSWIPDWTSGFLINKKPLALGSGTTFSYAAANDLELRIRVSDTVEDALMVSGSFLGEVAEVLEPAAPNDGSWGNSSDVFRVNFADEIRSIIRYCDSYLTGEDAIDIVWRTLVGNLDIRSHIPPDTWRDEFQFILNVFSPESTIEHDPQDTVRYSMLNKGFMAKFSVLNHDHAFCKLDNGLFALVPKETKPQDLIFLPSGSKAPFAVRQCGPLSDEYQILSTCYVHGLMFSNEHRPKFWNEEEICIR